MRTRRVAFALGLALATVSCTTTEISDLLRTAGGGSDNSLATVVAGLKQALEVGTERAVALTGKDGGYSDNLRIRIGTPEKLEKAASALRSLGLGSFVDDLELQMNRAAERAAGEAKPVFWDAVRDMTFDDARAILKGPDTAATDYFRARTEPRLRELYAPIVERTLAEVGAVREYNRLLERYAALPFTTRPDLRLEDYVTDRALDGLFTMLADEERRIRRDPVARTTELLRRVFGAVAGE